LNVWWDGDVPPENNWLREVSQALNRCDGMTVLVSPASMTSDLVTTEGPLSPQILEEQLISTNPQRSGRERVRSLPPVARDDYGLILRRHGSDPQVH
jgi:hypothetical protein